MVNADGIGAAQRNQACTNVGTGDPVHVPRSRLMVDPTDTDPDRPGATVLIGLVDVVGAMGVVSTATTSTEPDGLVPAT